MASRIIGWPRVRAGPCLLWPGHGHHCHWAGEENTSHWWVPLKHKPFYVWGGWRGMVDSDKYEQL